MSQEKAPYSETHTHPTHIDIPPPRPQAGPATDDMISPLTSAHRSAPPRGILKNPLRRPSQGGEGILSNEVDKEQYVEPILK